MDSGRRDHSRPDRIRRPVSCHASCTGKIVWEHSPTRRKYREKSRLNRGAPFLFSVTVPHCYQGSTILVGPPLANPHTPHGTPHGRPRELLPRVSATCASRGPPGLYHMASVPRHTSRRSCAPRQRPLATSACRLVNPFFSRFKIGKIH